VAASANAAAKTPTTLATCFGLLIRAPSRTKRRQNRTIEEPDGNERNALVTHELRDKPMNFGDKWCAGVYGRGEPESSFEVQSSKFKVETDASPDGARGPDARRACRSRASKKPLIFVRFFFTLNFEL
jgi:hypothetical protein